MRFDSKFPEVMPQLLGILIVDGPYPLSRRTLKVQFTVVDDVSEQCPFSLDASPACEPAADAIGDDRGQKEGEEDP